MQHTNSEVRADMSFNDALEPECEACAGEVEQLIRPRAKDLGEFTVRRVLPAATRRMVGPFIFFDHMGPADFPPGQGIQVRPHPHIGIATITYLFTGEIMHHDSLGFDQPIRPGAVNLMTAGRGIVHSERAGSDLHEHARLHGIQSWMALPDGEDEMAPAFDHTPAEALPDFDLGAVNVRLIMGTLFEHTSPVTIYQPMLYAELQMPAGSQIEIPAIHPELAAYVVTGQLKLGNEDVEAGVMAVAQEHGGLSMRAAEDTRVMIIGGEPTGPRHIWWNFVASSTERIEQAKRDWAEQKFDPVPGEDEFIPLPE